MYVCSCVAHRWKWSYRAIVSHCLTWALETELWSSAAARAPNS